MYITSGSQSLCALDECSQCERSLQNCKKDVNHSLNLLIQFCRQNYYRISQFFVFIQFSGITYYSHLVLL